MSSGVQIALVALGVILLFAVVIGVGVALVLGTTAALGGGYGNRAEGEGEFAGDRGAAIEAVKAALSAIDAREVALDATTGAIHARRPPSGHSGGEELIVRIEAAQPVRQRVAFESRSAVRGTRIDWRQNRRNVDAFLAALDRAPSQSAPQASAGSTPD